MRIDEHFPVTPDGWTLHLKRTVDSERLDPARRPVVIVPGYGMNAFIFGFHPRGTSMERSFAEAGLEVWSVNLRGQGDAKPRDRRTPGPSLRAYAEQDLATAIDHVLRSTFGRAERVDVIGASLGGSIVYAHMALAPGRHRVGSVVAVGAPLRWVEVPPILRVGFGSPAVAGMLRLQGTRALARVALPVATRLPVLLQMYMNAEHIDMSAAPTMVRTVEDPHPRVNRDIAKWIAAGDMVLRGVNVTEAVGEETGPLLILHANRDGIVPERTALSAREAWGGSDVATLRVGTGDDWYAHADLFVGYESKALVFDPLVRWLADHHDRA